MVEVPAGWFWMGCNQAIDRDCFAGDTWRHVYLDAFAIDRTEVTVAQYRRCVEAEECTEPGKKSLCNWGREGRDDHPVNCIGWQEATQFCEWAGRRLPRDAEWEKAARGDTGWKYPWGDTEFGAATKKWANVADESAKRDLPGRIPFIAEGYEDGFATTAPVGSFPDGASPYGALDMAGNVAECVWDKTIDGRGMRGGSWFNLPSDVRASGRIALLPPGRNDLLGFRCVQ
jgi:formylglycine-generating enzyme required for sulfatase activity